MNIGRFPLTIGSTVIYATELEECGRAERRAAERAAVTRLVGEVFGPGARLTHRDDGAPRVEGAGEVHVSVSHGAGLALLAVDRTRRVGVDVEQWRPALRHVADKILTAGELDSSRSDRTLLRAWTGKEAVFKTGITGADVISAIDLSALPADVEVVWIEEWPVAVAVAFGK